jgi:hypothetical protein
MDKTVHIAMVRGTKKEREKLARDARVAGYSLSNWIRQLIGLEALRGSGRPKKAVAENAK